MAETAAAENEVTIRLVIDAAGQPRAQVRDERLELRVKLATELVYRFADQLWSRLSEAEKREPPDPALRELVNRAMALGWGPPGP